MELPLFSRYLRLSDDELRALQEDLLADPLRGDLRPRRAVRAVRETTGLSQGDFAELVGVPVKTLQNWEQHRTRPARPARTLLRAIAKNLKAMLRALAA